MFLTCTGLANPARRRLSPASRRAVTPCCGCSPTLQSPCALLPFLPLAFLLPGTSFSCKALLLTDGEVTGLAVTSDKEGKGSAQALLCHICFVFSPVSHTLSDSHCSCCTSSSRCLQLATRGCMQAPWESRAPLHLFLSLRMNTSLSHAEKQMDWC